MNLFLQKLIFQYVKLDYLCGMQVSNNKLAWNIIFNVDLVQMKNWVNDQYVT